MAQLLSSEVETPSMLVLSPGPPKKVADQDWQVVLIELISGRRDLRTLENEDVLLCRKPTDEMALLIEGLGKKGQRERSMVLRTAIIFSLLSIVPISTNAQSIRPECAKMRDKIACTCALNNGGGITAHERWYSVHGPTTRPRNQAFTNCMIRSGRQ